MENYITAIEKHRKTWQGKSDEWLFERLDNELKQKVEEIHRLLAENEVKLFCRLHSMRKNCREYRNNKNSCKTCPHFVEVK
jgi:hypothetical protein